jgi:polysaccharide chain length determinant protein (PEP-CTERM system associated)
LKNFKDYTLADYSRMFWRRRWYFVLTFALVTGAVTIFAARLPHHYISETRILVESAFIPEDLVRPIVQSTAEERLSAIREQLFSRTFLERIIEENQLFGYGTFDSFSMEIAVYTLRKSFTATTDSRSTLKIAFSSTDPYFAQTMAKRFTNGLMRINVASRQNKALLTDQFLEEQLQETEKNLMAQEDKIKAFKNAHLGELPEQAAANMTMLSNLQGRLTAAETAFGEARERETQLAFQLQEQGRIKTLARTLAPAALQPAQDRSPANTILLIEQELADMRARLKTLSAKYTENFPDVESLRRQILELEKEVARREAASTSQAGGEAASENHLQDAEQVVTNSTSELETFLAPDFAEVRAELIGAQEELKRREKEKEEISQQIDALQARLKLTPSLDAEYQTLERDRDSLLQRYRILRDRKFQSEISANAETNAKNDSLRVIDDANLPEKPAFPNRTHIAFMGFCAGILLGCSAVFTREYLDPTLGSEKDIESQLRLPVLASLAEIHAVGEKKRGKESRRFIA